MITTEYFEFVIFSELEPVKKAIKKLRKELKESGDYFVVENPIDGFNGPFTANIKIELVYKSLAYKYLKHREEQRNFINSFNEFVLKGKFSEKHFGPIKIDLQVNSITKYPEVKVVVSHLATRNDWLSAWEHVEAGILQWENFDTNLTIKNRQKDFRIRLKIYKAYLRAKKHWDKKFTYNDFLHTDEIIELLPQLTSKDTNSKNLPYLLNKFEKEFASQTIISEEELSQPLK